MQVHTCAYTHTQDLKKNNDMISSMKPNQEKINRQNLNNRLLRAANWSSSW